MKKRPAKKSAPRDYSGLVGNISELLETARRISARAVNSLMTATYWEIGRRIIEFEQNGKQRAEYGDTLRPRLSKDLTDHYGRGFSTDNLESMHQFCRRFSPSQISETLSRILGSPSLGDLQAAFPLPWSHYVMISRRSRSPEALNFYHTEALRGGWTVRQLRRQIDSQFYERTALVRHSTDNLPNKVLVRDYLTALPDEGTLASEISSARRRLEARER